MSHHDPALQFHYKNVLGKDPGTIYSQHMAPEGDRKVNKPEGFRIPKIYFSWGVLAGPRDPHYHPDNDELLVVLSGNATISLTGPDKPGDRFEANYDVSAGDVVLFPQGWAHEVVDKGGEDDPVKVLVIFNNQDFKAVELKTSDESMCLGENA